MANNEHIESNNGQERRNVMNIGKSIKVALAMKGIKQKDLAEKMGRHHVYISQLCNKEKVGSKAIESVASALGMKVSELVALGEDSN